MNENKLCQYLKNLRKFYNYSQKTVSDYLNVTRQTYSHYETGRIVPPVNSLYKLSRLYGISVDNFLELIVKADEDMTSDQMQQMGNMEAADDLATFFEYINNSENSEKFKNLDQRERQMLFYYLLMDESDQKDVLGILKGKYQNRRHDD